jgi:membrane-bound lytic murein transglycosylase B
VKSLRILLGFLLLCVACSSQPSGVAQSPTPTESTTPTPSPQPSPTDAQPEPFRPAPGTPIPRKPAELAKALVKVTDALKISLDDWVANGDIYRRAPKLIVYQTLYQQRIYRLMARNEKLGDRTMAKLSGNLERFARGTVTAGRRLRSLVRPVDADSEFLTQRPEPAGNLLRYYKKAERRFDVDWEVLAAINYVETKFGRVKSASYAGAQGPMQFLPSTWDAYGMGGDIHDPHDAILGAANYLAASGAPQDYRGALYAYNPAEEYVDAIWLYAKQIFRSPRNYFAYYNWQVFVITTEGEERLTGPGR